jgi:5-oxoprolinase (ATP-hydrolysing)
MTADFEAAHRARYGFVPTHGELVIEVLSSEAIGGTGETGRLPTQSLSDVPTETVRMMAQHDWQDVPLIDRSSLPVSLSIEGPAIIVEPTGTNVVEPGWRAERAVDGNLIIERYLPREKQEAIGTAVDPVMLEVFNNLFMSIAEQMGATLANTAYSVNIKERLDFSCAIFDAGGGLVANAPHVPVHLGSMGESVRAILDNNEGNIHPGDVFVLNNPFKGGTHLPDVTVVTPIFDETGSELLFLVASRGHHADIGGTTPGSCPPDSTHIEQEGVLIDNFKLVDQGRLRDQDMRDLLASGPYPCRNIDQNMADLSAQVAANKTGAQELSKMVQHFGIKVVQAYMGHVQDNAEEFVRRVIDELNDATFDYGLDDGQRIKVALTVDRASRSLKVDFTGTSDQDAGNYNAPLAICRACVLYVLRTLVGADIPLNEGCMKPVELIVPEGSIINPSFPAAVIAGNTEVSQAIAETLYGALGAVAGSQGTMNNLVYGDDEYQNYETICGGTGAGAYFDGADAVHSHMTNTRMTDPEVLETRFPVRVEDFRIRKGSGGDGLRKGGDGIVRELKFLREMTVTLITSNRQKHPFGVRGGEDGQAGSNRVKKNDGTIVPLGGNDSALMQPGDSLIMETPGGGGFGKPAS